MYKAGLLVELERLGRGFPCLPEGSMYQSRGDVFQIWETEPSVVCIEIYIVSILFVTYIYCLRSCPGHLSSPFLQNECDGLKTDSFSEKLASVIA